MTTEIEAKMRELHCKSLERVYISYGEFVRFVQLIQKEALKELLSDYEEVIDWLGEPPSESSNAILIKHLNKLEKLKSLSKPSPLSAGDYSPASSQKKIVVGKESIHDGEICKPEMLGDILSKGEKL
jgi:hypothetical protein